MKVIDALPLGAQKDVENAKKDLKTFTINGNCINTKIVKLQFKRITCQTEK